MISLAIKIINSQSSYRTVRFLVSDAGTSQIAPQRGRLTSLIDNALRINWVCFAAYETAYPRIEAYRYYLESACMIEVTQMETIRQTSSKPYYILLYVRSYSVLMITEIQYYLES